MGDWESTFGEGISAESVISGLNAEYFAEEHISEAEERTRRKANLLAFQNDPKLKAKFMAHLREVSARGLFSAKEGGLKRALQDEARGFSEFYEIYRIPETLSHLVDKIYYGLRCINFSAWPEQRFEVAASEWLIKCFNTIRPGADLHYIAPRLAAQVASEAQNLFRGKPGPLVGEGTRETCEPALTVAYARARGVILQDSYTSEALEIARMVLRNAYTEITYIFPRDFAVAIVEGAADTAPDGAGRAVEYAARARLRIGGDASDQCNLWEYANELLGNIANAPTYRVKIIDLNKAFPLRLE